MCFSCALSLKISPPPLIFGIWIASMVFLKHCVFHGFQDAHIYPNFNIAEIEMCLITTEWCVIV